MVSQISRGQGNEFLNRLEAAGLDSGSTQKVINSKDNKFALRVVRFIQSEGFEPTTSQKRAREIMGRNFFGVEEAIKHFGIHPIRQQLAALSEIPFSEATLEALKNTHILVAVFPISILDIRGMMERKIFYSYKEYDSYKDWYSNQFFAKERGEVGWQLVRKTPVDNSTWKNWQEQQSLIGKDDEVPSAQVMVYTIIGYYLVTSERLFENEVRTSSVVEDHHVVIYFGSEGLRINAYGPGACDSLLSVSSARKF